MTLVAENFKDINDAFVILAARSGCYPNISEEFFIDFCLQNRIVKSDQKIEQQKSQSRKDEEILSPVKLTDMAQSAPPI